MTFTGALKDNRYYIMESRDPDRMLLYSMPELPQEDHDSWMFGQPFTEEPTIPIEVEIQERYLNAKLLPFFEDPPLVTLDFYQTLLDAGVDNLMAYDAEIVSEDRKIRHKGYKAINIIGLIRAAGPGTVYIGGKRLIDAAIDGLEIVPQAALGLFMFRLAESISAIVVHEKVKNLIEQRGFGSIVFIEPTNYLSL